MVVAVGSPHTQLAAEVPAERAITIKLALAQMAAMQRMRAGPRFATRFALYLRNTPVSLVWALDAPNWNSLDPV